MVDRGVLVNQFGLYFIDKCLTVKMLDIIIAVIDVRNINTEKVLEKHYHLLWGGKTLTEICRETGFAKSVPPSKNKRPT